MGVNNKDENSPVIFSERYENISEMIYIEDEADARNVAYVLSDGEGANQKLHITDVVKGFERKEITFEISSRDSDNDSYVDVPDLAKKKIRRVFCIR